MFQALSVEGWRQYRSVEIEFHKRLTVLTGANGAGKTTLLNILNRHFGWNIQFMSTPVTRRGALSWLNGRLPRQSESKEIEGSIGRLVYGDGSFATLVVPENVPQQYNVQISGQQQVSGIFLPSHRPVYSYQPVDNIPTQVDAREQLLEQYLGNLRQLWAANARVQSPSMRLKQSLISLATFGPGNSLVERNDEAMETFEGFQRVLRSVLPAQLGFERIAIRLPEVVFECRSGDFSLDAASGGVAALVDVAWQIYLKSVTTPGEFVVVADEPENHLHPELQRSLLPGLMSAFPQAQFIVATHNPFIVGSVPESNVYVMNFVEHGFSGQTGVETTLLDLVNKGGTSNEILREALGVPLPTSIWVEEVIERVAQSLDRADVTLDDFRAARIELAALGLEQYLGQVLPGEPN